MVSALTPMATPHKFETLREQLAVVAQDLKQCTGQKERRALLRRKRVVINEVDQLIQNEPSLHLPHVFDIRKVGR